MALWSRAWLRGGRRAGWGRGALLALAALAASAWRVPVSEELAAPLAAAPRDLAHLLADFTAHPKLYPHIGSWSLEREERNLSRWSYGVRYTCGARCEGRAELSASEREHDVLLQHTECRSWALLPWSTTCEEWSVWMHVSAAAGGALYREVATRRCAAWRAALGACGAALRAERARHLQTLTLLLRH